MEMSFTHGYMRFIVFYLPVLVVIILIIVILVFFSFIISVSLTDTGQQWCAFCPAMTLSLSRSCCWIIAIVLLRRLFLAKRRAEGSSLE